MGIKVQFDNDLFNALPSARSAFLIGSPSSPSTSSADRSNSKSHRVLYALPHLPVPSNISAQAWHAEHASAITNMLPGGLGIVGVFSRDDTNPKSLESCVCDEPVLLLQTQGSTKPTVKVMGDQMKFKQATPRAVRDLASTVVTFVGMLRIDDLYPLPVDRNDNREECIKNVKQLANQLVIELTKGEEDKEKLFVTDVQDDRSISQILGIKTGPSKKSQKSRKKQPDNEINQSTIKQARHQINVFCPITSNYHDAAPTLTPTKATDSNSNICNLSGHHAVVAVIPRDCTAGDALRAVREDVSRSILARYDLFCECEDTTEYTKNNRTTSLPIRVLVNGVNSNGNVITMTDYMANGETIEDDVTSRIADVVSWTERQVNEAQFETLESVNSKMDNNDVINARTTLESLPVEIINNEVREDDAKIEGHDELPPILVNGIFLAVVLAVLAIIVRQVL